MTAYKFIDHTEYQKLSKDEMIQQSKDFYNHLKKRRTRKPDVCEMICGGCGEIFDICDLETADILRNSAG